MANPNDSLHNDPRGLAQGGEAAHEAPLPPEESARLALLAECHIMDTVAERDFDDLTILASQICGTPIALISLVDEARQWFKSRVGLEATETPRRLAFCAHAILEPGKLLVVPDATKDRRFAENELVTGELGIRFYAGAPLVMEDGMALGSLCVIDRQPRELSASQRTALEALARQVVSQIQLRRQNVALLHARSERELFFTLQITMFCIVGTDGFFKQLNPTFGETLGYTTGELLASSFLSFVHPDDVAATLAEVDWPSHGIRTREFVNRYRCKDGSYRWLSWRTAPSPEGLLYAAARDITEAKRAEDKLRALSELRRGILGSAVHCIIATTPEGLITEFNPAAERMLGYKAEDMIGHLTPAIIHDPEEVVARAAEFSAELGRTIEPGFEVFVAKSRLRLPNEHEWFYVRKGGSRFPVRLTITALWDGPGKIVGFLGIATDITKRKYAEARLIESEKRFREAIEYSAIGMALVGLDGRWMKVNHALCAIVGRSAEELLRGKFQDITHADDIDEDMAQVQALFEGKIDHFQREKRYLHGEGRIVWVMLAVTLVHDADGKPLHYVAQLDDITERREAAERMKASLAEKETLLKEVHHRVKNNLQVITSLLELQSASLSDPVLRARFREAQDRVRAMALIHEGLYRSGNLAAVDFGVHVRKLVASLLRSYSTGAVPIAFHAETDEVQLDIDVAVPLSLIVNELVTNACKHAFAGGRGGTLHLIFQAREADMLLLSIGDDGPGLPPGFQWEKSPSLGLKVVRILVSQIGGRIGMPRPSEARFEIIFPRNRKSANPT